MQKNVGFTALNMADFQYLVITVRKSRDIRTKIHQYPVLSCAHRTIFKAENIHI